MICPKCNTVNSDEEKFCKNCGFQLTSSRICPTCGKTNDSNSKYCKECGTVLTPVNTFRKQIIEENTKESFFSMYKIPIICALVILLAIGAVTGMAFYNGNSGGDDGINTFIPTDNNTGGLFSDDVTNDPTQAKMQENATNQTNKTNDTNTSKSLTEKIENKTKNATSSLTEKVENKTKNATNSLTEKVENKTKNATKTITEKVENKTNMNKDNKSSSKSNSSKTITEKTNTDDKNKSNKNPISSPDKNSSLPGFIVKNDTEDTINDSIDELKNDTEDALNDSLEELENDTEDILSDSSDDVENDTEDAFNDTEDNDTDEGSPSEIEMTDVPNLAMKVADRGYSFSTIDYMGNEYSEAQCIYIFSEYLLNVNDGKTSPIEIKEFSSASNPSGDDESQSIEKSDYLSIANRVHSWMDSQNSVPNYVGVSEVGVADLSPSKMLKLFTQATLDYAVTGDLPKSVEI